MHFCRLALRALAGVLLAFAGTAPAARAATLTHYATETSFLGALGPEVVVGSESFDGFADGAAISTQVPGVIFSSPNSGFPGFVEIQTLSTPASVSPPNILWGGFVDGSPLQQVIVLDFAAPASALSFHLTAQYPTAMDVFLQLDFTDDTSETLVVMNAEGPNNPVEFFGVTSDVPFSRARLISGDEAGGQFQEYGGIDDLRFGIRDLNPPICSGRPALQDGVLGVDGGGRDDRIGDTGIASVDLADGAANLVLSVDPGFLPGDPTVSFRVAQADSGLEAEGTVLVTDGAGNTCSLCLNFRTLAEGPTSAEVICCAEGVVFSISNAETTPGGTAVCTSAPFSEDQPDVPPGYEPSPEEDPFPCTVLTIESPIAGPTEMVLKKDGDFDPMLRMLFSRSEDGGMTFPPFADVTEAVEPILDVIPDPTRIKGKTDWSPVKIACAIHAELCNGLDDDGDGLTDEGLPVGDETVDQDLDGFFLCPPEGEAADCNDQIFAIHPEATEVCNGLDDDCDTAIDQGNPGGGEACEVEGQLGECAAGLTECVDGALDCPQSVFPVGESCDSLDNDCDGATDEDFADLGSECTASSGGCTASGTLVCSPGGEGTVCSAVPGEPGTEVCDGADNDCDGSTDENRVFGGYEDPVNQDGSSIFKSTSVIPFKFRLTDCAGNAVVTATPPTISVLFFANGIVGTVLEDVRSPGKANDGNLYRFDAKGNNYVFNLSAKTLTPDNSYIVRTTLDDGTSHDVIISVIR